jgi:hypothetical protein
LTHPVRFSVDYEPRQPRLGAVLRWLLAVPHLVVVGLLAPVALVVAVVAWFAIVVTGRYPRALFALQVGYLRWFARTQAYVYLLTRRYPPFSFGSSADGYPVRLDVDYPERLSRRSTLFRVVLLVPAAVVLYLVAIVGGIALVMSWIVATVLGRLPLGLHEVGELVVRYGNRLRAYQLLVTDAFPWFQPEAGAPAQASGGGAVSSAAPSVSR